MVFMIRFLTTYMFESCPFWDIIVELTIYPIVVPSLGQYDLNDINEELTIYMTESCPLWADII